MLGIRPTLRKTIMIIATIRIATVAMVIMVITGTIVIVTIE